MARKKLGEMLVEAGVINEQALRMALAEQRRWGGTLGRTLIDMKAISEQELVAALSQQLALPTIDLDNLEISPTILELIPGELAEQYSLVPFAQPMKFLDVAMADPTNIGVIDELRIRTQLNIRPYLAGPKMIERALATHYRRGFGRMNLRSNAALQIDTADTFAMSPSGDHLRPNAVEVEAARRREGLRPSPPTRPPPTRPAPIAMPPPNRDAEIDALQDRISKLEALVERDEEVLRKLLALLVEKGVATREEILERIR
jgi:type IV pilus assembly protein PilB